ncbi:DUF4190 domain-containing protein [Nocardioides sp. R-C-SC26]|uniref:DUF4190 domain-containing protein n=1 Tax=Nocardioides sp. R-C-SC26 TaxID=2870414 RepID=UPI001E343944|nr:DUF4190 domain-containing protein [Nocardioides sp. R-C-SC26]
MSNPYDPPNPPSDGQPPYGTPPGGYTNNPGPYPPAGGGFPPPGDGGVPPYGSNPYGAPQQPAGNDAVSITGFVLSLTCCLSVVGLILGIIGLKRTKNNQRKGRWAAIAAIPIGIVGTLALVGAIIFGVFIANNVITPDSAEVGQCADISSEDKDSISLFKKDCEGNHDVEIVYVGKYSEVEESQFMPSNPDDLTDAGISYGICTGLMDQADVAKLDAEDVEYGFVTDGEDPDGDDVFFCYVEKSGGGNLKGSLLD